MNYLQKATEQLFIYKTPKKIVEYIKRERILKLIQNPKFKMEKLELKHLAPYLPYELKVSKIHTLNIGTGIGSINHILTTRSKNYKPILRPMSDLTTDVLYKAMNTLGHSAYIDWTTNEREYLIEKRGFNGWLNNIPYIIILFLFENHFDVFKLIDKGLAISYSDAQST